MGLTGTDRETGDAELVERARAGDAGAREEIVRRHTKTATAAVKSLARRLERRATEDDDAEALVSLLTAVEDFDPALGVPFGAFVRIRVEHDARDRFRKEGRRRRIAAVQSEADVATKGDASPVGTAADRYDAVASALDFDEALSGKDRASLARDHVRRLDGDEAMIVGFRTGRLGGPSMTSWSKIAFVMESTPEAVKKRYQRACRKIADAIDGES